MSFRSWMAVLLVLTAGIYSVHKGYIPFPFPKATGTPQVEISPPASQPQTSPPKPLVEANTPSSSRQAASIYFLLERTSITTDSGVYGIAAGTRMWLIDRKEGQLHLSDGQVDFWAPESAVTSDEHTAGLAKRMDARAQAQIQNLVAQQKAIAHKKEAENLELQRQLSEKQSPQASFRPVAIPASQTSTNPLERGPYRRSYGISPYRSYPYDGRNYSSTWGIR